MLIAAGLMMLAIVVSLVVQVEDWSRDLSVNYAETSPNSKEPNLRTLVTPADEAAVRAAILKYVEQSPSWTLNEKAVGEQSKIALVRTSRLFRFSDDVTVSLQTTDAGTSVDAISQSRVGKGDLGQNPRNLRELLGVLREEKN